MWRPADWPGQPLVLNVVGNPNPPRAVSAGNRFTPLYSASTARAPVRRSACAATNGFASRCATISDRTWGASRSARVQTRSSKSRKCSPPPSAACSRKSASIARRHRRRPLIFEHIHELLDAMPAPVRDTSCLPGPINMPHASHTTNLHTHGLHVNPGINANGTFGDNTFSRVLPRADGEMRRTSKDANCRRPLEPTERVGEGHYEYALSVPRNGAGAAGATVPHPPGTHWYHPHSHGATHDQVASGLAGFLIVEGDVDDAINRAMTGTDRPDPSQKTGPYDYRERLILLQRVEVFSADVERSRRQAVRVAPPTSVNGGLHADGDVHAPGRGGALARAQRQRGRPWLQTVHGARRAVRVQRPPVVARAAWIGSGGAAQARARHARGHREGHASVVPTLVRRHHARRDRERARAPHDPRSLEAERRQPESARSSRTRGRAARTARC